MFNRTGSSGNPHDTPLAPGLWVEYMPFTTAQDSSHLTSILPIQFSTYPDCNVWTWKWEYCLRHSIHVPRSIAPQIILLFEDMWNYEFFCSCWRPPPDLHNFSKIRKQPYKDIGLLSLHPSDPVRLYGLSSLEQSLSKIIHCWWLSSCLKPASKQRPERPCWWTLRVPQPCLCLQNYWIVCVCIFMYLNICNICNT